MSSLRTVLATCLILAAFLAGCGAPAAPVVIEPTVTPLASAGAAAPATPAAGATAERLVALEAVQADIDAGRFGDALDRLHRAAMIWGDHPEISQRAAVVYLTWGQSLVGESNGDGTRIELARERLVNGLAQAPEASQIAMDIAAEIARADQLLVISEIVRELKQFAAQPSEQGAQRAIELVGQMDQAAAQLGDSAILPPLLYDGLVAAGDALRGGGTRADRCAFYQRAAEMQGIDTGSARERLAVCAAEQATPTPQPTPTKIPVQLVVLPDVRGSDPGAAQKFLEGQGFKVVLTQISDAAQLGGLCKQMVSYTAPKGGSRVEKGIEVRVFYRGFDSFASPANCPPGR
jgi:hypothetical protein